MIGIAVYTKIEEAVAWLEKHGGTAMFQSSREDMTTVTVGSLTVSSSKGLLDCVNHLRAKYTAYIE